MLYPKLIAFTGKIGAGKSTAAQYLYETHKYRKMPFAQTLKEMLIYMGLSAVEVYGSQKEVPNETILGGKTPRHAMQTLGTEWGRNLIHPDIWVDCWKRKASLCKDRIVVDDARFPNEFRIIEELNGIIVNIERAPTLNEPHESEQHKPSRVFDMISNGLTINDLHDDIDQMLKTYSALISDAP